MDEQVFFTYVAHVLAPTLQRGDIVVLDNLSAHKSPRVEDWVRSARARSTSLSDRNGRVYKRWIIDSTLRAVHSFSARAT